MLQNTIPAASPEVVALGSALVDIITAAKAPGSTALGDAEAALPDLVASSASIANIGADIKLPQNQAFLLYAIGLAFGV